MSDVDRLHQAADTQDDHGEGKAIADLLRAVATAAEWSQTHGNGTPPADSYIGAAALALADEILRGAE